LRRSLAPEPCPKPTLIDNRLILSCAASLLAVSAYLPAKAAPEGVSTAIARIIDEGMNRSESMITASALMDRIGPRLTNSENIRKAQAWAMERLRKPGVVNVHTEPFDFGLGWNIVSAKAPPRGFVRQPDR
jgi:hypothetical protein